MGFIIYKDNIYGGGSGGSGGASIDRIEITQAEYDALSEDEKNADVVYFITDAEGGSDEPEKEIVYVGSNPNLLINGDFQVWQRGTSFDLQTAGKFAYTADRWSVATSNSYHIEKAENGGITLACSLYQLLETPLKPNENYVLSACINDTIHTLNIKGGADSSNGLLMYKGDASKSYIRISNQDTSVVQTIKWVKLEQGSVVTPFVPRLYADELVMCEKYYYTQTFAGIPYYSGQYLVQHHKMRIQPTVTFSYVGALNSSGNWVSDSNPTIKEQSNGRFIISTTCSPYHSLQIGANLDAEIY